MPENTAQISERIVKVWSGYPGNISYIRRAGVTKTVCMKVCY